MTSALPAYEGMFQGQRESVGEYHIRAAAPAVEAVLKQARELEAVLAEAATRAPDLMRFISFVPTAHTSSEQENDTDENAADEGEEPHTQPISG